MSTPSDTDNSQYADKHQRLAATDDRRLLEVAVIVALSVIGLVVVVGGFYMTYIQAKIPPELIAIGSAAVGGLVAHLGPRRS